MAREIDDTAANWVARSDSGRMSPEDHHALAQWLGADPRHAGAFARARAILSWSGRADATSAAAPRYQRALQPAAQPGVPDRRSHRHRSKLAAFAAIVVAAVALGSIGYLRLQSQESYATVQGEVRRLSLRDGSSITLNTASQARVTWSDGARRVQLLEGEALFDVSPDAARPFIVETASTAVRAVGTSFTVRRLDAGQIEVVVREGEVEVESLDAIGSEATSLRANTRAIDGPGRPPTVEPLNDEQVTQHLSWRDGMIAFDGDTLAEAAREFARYSPTPLRIDDARVADLRIVGLFASNDPAGFARAAAMSLGLEAEIDEDGIRLRHRRDHR